VRDRYGKNRAFPAALTEVKRLESACVTSLATHPQRNTIRLQLRENPLLRSLTREQWANLEPLLMVADYRKGDPLVRQGDEEMEQFFVLDGMVKRVVSNPEGHEMILRFAAGGEMDTSYAAWRLRTPIPYSIVAVSKARTAELPLAAWVDFLGQHPELKARFEYEVMKLMSEVMAHTITLHLLDAPGRLARFHRKHPELAGRIPKKELAAYLNLTPETLSRLKQKLGG